MRDEAAGATQVVIGHDMRESSPALTAAFADGVMAQGLDVVRIGLASTDELYFASGLLDCPGAMFTASHNPAAYNGIKLCRAAAKPVGEDTGLADDPRRGHRRGAPASTARRARSAIAMCSATTETFLRSLVDVTELRPLRVAVDAGNGMAGHTAPAVLGPIPAVTLLPLYFELDGSFPNHEANPLEPANLVDLQRHVLDDRRRHRAGLRRRRRPLLRRRRTRRAGVAVGGHRAGGRPRTGPRTGLDGDPQPDHLPGGARSRSPSAAASAVRSRVGHSYIKALMAQTGAIFGGEHSAHYYFRDFWGADSGMLAALHVLAALGEQDRPLSEVMADYQRYAASGEINFRVDDAPACVDAVLNSFAGRRLFRSITSTA